MHDSSTDVYGNVFDFNMISKIPAALTQSHSTNYSEEKFVY